MLLGNNLKSTSTISTQFILFIAEYPFLAAKSNACSWIRKQDEASGPPRESLLLTHLYQTGPTASHTIPQSTTWPHKLPHSPTDSRRIPQPLIWSHSIPQCPTAFNTAPQSHIWSHGLPQRFTRWRERAFKDLSYEGHLTFKPTYTESSCWFLSLTKPLSDRLC